jgi:elongation factor P--(R)-beta-lysine ligase
VDQDRYAHRRLRRAGQALTGDLLRARHLLLRSIRGFFDESGSLEVETPAIVRSPGVDAWLDAIPAGRGFLATSPEYHMKRLVAAGSGPIHQLGKAWRSGETGALHEPEFTMLEWYVPGLDDAGLMDQTERLVRAVVTDTGADADLPERPFERLTYRQAFARHAGFDPADAADRRFGLILRASGVRPPRSATREELEDLVLATVIQPKLAGGAPCFVTDWPIERAALARIRPGRDEDAAPSAARFELYWRGLELCNGYHELTDASEQRRRIDHENVRRIELGRLPYPVDEDFLAALQAGMPDCAGNALGVDRLQMALTGAASLDEVRAFRLAPGLGQPPPPLESP